jgi:RNA processing factor Prp31
LIFSQLSKHHGAGKLFHTLEVLKADKKSRGKVARRLASQIVLSARMDYFSKLKNH